MFILILALIIILIISLLWIIRSYYVMKFSLKDLHENQWKELKQKVWNDTDNYVDFGKFSHEKYVKVAGTLYKNNKIEAVDEAYKEYVAGLISIKFLYIFNLGKNIPHKGRYPDD